MKTLNVTDFRKNIYQLVKSKETVRIFANGYNPKIVIDEDEYFAQVLNYNKRPNELIEYVKTFCEDNKDLMESLAK